MFNCKGCKGKTKKAKGCVSPTRIKQAVFSCPICSGENKKCVYCKGKNEIPIKQCPRSLGYELLPYLQHFFRYIDVREFPDGRGMLFQPKKLKLLFSVWSAIYYELKEKMDKPK
jgi:hypothetical protein